MSDWISQLERAKSLLDSGALSQEEFEATKARLFQKDQPSPPPASSNAGKGLIIGAIALGGVGLGYILVGPSKGPPAPIVIASKETPPAAKIEAPAPPVEEITKPQTFACLGSYSDVSFSEESGDASGLLVRVYGPNRITWKVFEGSTSKAEVRVTSVTPERIQAIIQYISEYNDPPSDASLHCKGSYLSVTTSGLGTVNLPKIPKSQADKLDL